jgi:PhzF family phenazine biosynthesis protein
MGIPIYLVDAFTSIAYRGNPAAICMLEKRADENWMQQVAAEMNLSETAFVRPSAGGYELRWFTPKAEVDLCGHATLAAAHVMWENGMLPHDHAASFSTRSGVLQVKRSMDGWMVMDFPSIPPAAGNSSQALLQALRLERLVYAGGNGMDLFVEVESEAVLLALEPDFEQLAKLPARGVVVTTRSESQDYDFKSRAFYPAIGVNEDPVTGSAHCALAPYWAAKLGKTELMAYQASERGGVLRVRAADSRVAIEGEAVTVFRGELSERAQAHSVKKRGDSTLC